MCASEMAKPGLAAGLFAFRQVLAYSAMRRLERAVPIVLKVLTNWFAADKQSEAPVAVAANEHVEAAQLPLAA